MVVSKPKSIPDMTSDEHNESANAKQVLLVDGGGDFGNNVGKFTTEAGPNSEFMLEVGKGNITGYTPIFFTGINQALSTVEQTIRTVGARYPFPISAGTWLTKSTSANDTILGTGARELILLGLDDDHIEQAEVIPLNGLTPVSTSLNWFRVNFYQIISAGTSKVNEGTIDLYVGSDILARIEPTEGRALQCVSTVPAGKTWYTGNFFPSCGKGDEVLTFARFFQSTGAGAATSKTFQYQNTFPFTNMTRIGFPEKFDFEATAIKTGSSGSARISLVLEFLEVTNSLN